MTTIIIYKTSGCQSCAKAMKVVRKVVNEVKKDIPKLKVEEKDITEHPDDIIKYNILSSPTIVIDDTVAFRGVPTADELKKALKKK